MSRRKFVFCNFREYEGASFAEFLERMAAKGWFAEQKIFGSLWRFRSGRPVKRHYYAAVMPGSSQLMIEESGETQDYRELCEEAGWKLECKAIIWQIFYAEREDVIPIETDPKLRLETIRSILLTPWAAAGDWMEAIFLLGIAFWILMTGTIGSSLEQQVGFVVLSLRAVFRIVQRFEIIKWYKNAKALVSEGEGIPETSPDMVRMRGRLQTLGSVGSILIGLWIIPLLQTLISVWILVGIYRELLRFLRENRDILRQNDPGKKGEKARIILIASAIALFFGFMLSVDVTRRILPAWREIGIETDIS